MSLEKKIKNIINRLCDIYGYSIQEFISNDNLNKFWGITKEIDGLRTNIVFLDNEEYANQYFTNEKSVMENQEEKLIKVIFVDEEKNEEKLKTISNLIIINNSNNNILITSDMIEGEANQIVTVLNSLEGNNQTNFSRSPITLAIIGINVFMYIITAILSKNLISSDINVLVQLGAKYNEGIAAGEYYRLITCMFLHGGIIHLVLNMYALYAIGPLIENIYGRTKYVIIYFISGICASLLSFMMSPSISIGASGAIFGLLGATLIFAINMKDRIVKGFLSNILSVIVINIVLGVSISNVDNFGHVGGLIGGIICSLFFISKIKNQYN